MTYARAVQAAETMYGENWFQRCSITLTRLSRTELGYVVWADKPSMFALRRV